MLRFVRVTFSFLFLFSAMLVHPVVASGKDEKKEDTKVSKSSKKKSNGHKKKRLGVDQSDFMPDARQFGLIFSYSFDYDSLQTTSPHQLGHYLGVAGTYSIDKNYSLFGSVSLSHRSEKLRIVREGPKDAFHQVSNLSGGVVYSHQENPDWIVRNALTLSATFPLSDRSRVNQMFIAGNLSHYIQSKPFWRVSFYNRVRANYLGHRLKFTVWDNDGFSGQRLNRDWLVQNSTGINLKIADRIGLRSSLSINNVRFLDDSWNFSFGNQTSIFANYFGVQFYLQMYNQSYPENESLQLLYFDKYRRFFGGGLTYAF